MEQHRFAPNAASLGTATFFSQLKIYNGTFSNDSVLSLFFRPFPLILSPVVRDYIDVVAHVVSGNHSSTEITDVVCFFQRFNPSRFCGCVPYQILVGFR